jgi:hypothetical protein
LRTASPLRWQRTLTVGTVNTKQDAENLERRWGSWGCKLWGGKPSDTGEEGCGVVTAGGQNIWQWVQRTLVCRVILTQIHGLLGVRLCPVETALALFLHFLFTFCFRVVSFLK